MPEVLYQMERRGKRAIQWRDIEKVCERGIALWGEKDSARNKIDCQRINCHANVCLISEIKNVC